MVASFGTQGTFVRDNALVVNDDTLSRQITVAAGQNLRRGTLLGRLTASGSYVLSTAAATDGSQAPAVILAEDCDASAADRVTVGYFSGMFDENRVIFGAGHTAASTREALRDLSILLQSSIV